MTIASTDTDMPEETVDITVEDPEGNRRQHERVEVNLLGRCMFADQEENPCEMRNVSAGGAAIISPLKGNVGEKIIIYAEQIGRIEGIITRHTQNGFAITITASARKREKLANTLAWLGRRDVLKLRDDRRSVRRVPATTETRVTLPGGRQVDCKIIDMSKTGAALAISERPPIGSRVNLGRLGGRVVRHFSDGIAIEFMRIMSEEEIEQIIEEEFFTDGSL